MKLSVVVPIYKVEPYIEKCARSLFEQTYEKLEYIFVDDCSPDKSVEVLEKVLGDYPNRQSQVKLIRLEKNSGVIAARKRAYEIATGDAIIHCDSDDWVDEDFYEKLLRRMQDTDADMVFAPMVENESTPLSSLAEIDFLGTGKEYLEAVGKIIAFNSMVNKVFRRKLVSFPPIEIPETISIGEDLCRMTLSVLRCKKVASIKGSYYHYFVNPESISHAFNARKAVDHLSQVYRLITERACFPETALLRKQILRDVLYFGLRFGVLTTKEGRELAKEMRGLKNVPFSSDTSRFRRLVVEAGSRMFVLTRLILRMISWKKIRRV